MPTYDQTAIQTTPELSAENQGWIDKFKTRIAEFTNVFTRLKSIGPQMQSIPELNAEYQSLMARGNAIQTTIDTLTGSINKAVQWFKNVFGMDGVGMAGRGQLGVLPLLPIAAISGALALIGYWVSDVYTFNEKLKKFDDLTASGQSAQEAARIISQLTDKPGLFDTGLGKWIMPVIIVGGLWWFMRGRSL
jgi:hypothetical protein